MGKCQYCDQPAVRYVEWVTGPFGKPGPVRVPYCGKCDLQEALAKRGMTAPVQHGVDYTIKVPPTQGGCWYCHTTLEPLVFCHEFDTYIHIECIPTEAEAKHDREAQMIRNEFKDQLEPPPAQASNLLPFPIVDLPLRWGWRVEWHGWRRCLWWALMADFSIPLFGLVLFGLEVSYGKRFVLETENATYTVTRSRT